MTKRGRADVLLQEEKEEEEEEEGRSTVQTIGSSTCFGLEQCSCADRSERVELRGSEHAWPWIA